MKTRLQFRKEVGHGGVVPEGWRMAWYEPPSRLLKNSEIWQRSGG